MGSTEKAMQVMKDVQEESVSNESDGHEPNVVTAESSGSSESQGIGKAEARRIYPLTGPDERGLHYLRVQEGGPTSFDQSLSDEWGKSSPAWAMTARKELATLHQEEEKEWREEHRAAMESLAEVKNNLRGQAEGEISSSDYDSDGETSSSSSDGDDSDGMELESDAVVEHHRGDY